MDSAPLYANLSRALAVIGQAYLHASQLLSAPGQQDAPFVLPLSPLSLHSPEPCSVIQTINEFIRAKARSGRSDRYLQALRVSLHSFAKGRSQRPLGSVTLAEIEDWMAKSNWSPRTQRGYLSDVRVLFNWAVKRGLVKANPAAAVEEPVIEDTKPPSIHTPEQVRTVLDFAMARDLNLCRCLAVRYFTGIRSAEVARLQEGEIHLAEKFIEVPAAKAKTRRRRLVTIQPNLAAWLQLGGKLPLHDVNNRMRFFSADLKAKHGIEWEHNVTRHSFVSYHLAQFGSAAKTALEAGHTEQMTFAHYRAIVTPAAAADYWSIYPK